MSSPISPTLTSREAEIIGMIAAGDTPKKIAGRLGISPRTVETHLRSVRQKTGARTTARAAVVFASTQVGAA